MAVLAVLGCYRDGFVLHTGRRVFFARGLWARRPGAQTRVARQDTTNRRAPKTTRRSKTDRLYPVRGANA